MFLRKTGEGSTVLFIDKGRKESIQFCPHQLAIGNDKSMIEITYFTMDIALIFALLVIE